MRKLQNILGMLLISIITVSLISCGGENSTVKKELTPQQALKREIDVCILFREENKEEIGVTDEELNELKAEEKKKTINSLKKLEKENIQSGLSINKKKVEEMYNAASESLNKYEIKSSIKEDKGDEVILAAEIKGIDMQEVLGKSVLNILLISKSNPEMLESKGSEAFDTIMDVYTKSFKDAPLVKEATKLDIVMVKKNGYWRIKDRNYEEVGMALLNYDELFKLMEKKNK